MRKRRKWPEDPAHAPGKRHRQSPGDADAPPKKAETTSSHDQPWVPTSGLVGRRRRSPRRG